MATVVNVHKAQRNLSKLAKRAAAREEIVIASRGKPVAILTRLPRQRKDLPWGFLKGKIRMTRDFGAPLDVFNN